MEQWERSSVESKGSAEDEQRGKEEEDLPSSASAAAAADESSFLSLSSSFSSALKSPLSAPGAEKSFPESLSVSSEPGRHSDAPSTSTEVRRLLLASRVESRGAARARPRSDERQLRSKKLCCFAGGVFCFYR